MEASNKPVLWPPNAAVNEAILRQRLLEPIRRIGPRIHTGNCLKPEKLTFIDEAVLGFCVG